VEPCAFSDSFKVTTSRPRFKIYFCRRWRRGAWATSWVGEHSIRNLESASQEWRRRFVGGDAQERVDCRRASSSGLLGPKLPHLAPISKADGMPSFILHPSTLPGVGERILLAGGMESTPSKYQRPSVFQDYPTPRSGLRATRQQGTKAVRLQYLNATPKWASDIMTSSSYSYELPSY
jgi:hypothetical protein